MRKPLQDAHEGSAPRLDKEPASWTVATAAEGSRWFEADPTPVFILEADLVVMAANQMAMQLLRDGRALAVRARRLAFNHADAQQSFTLAVKTFVSTSRAPRGVVLRCNDGLWRKLELSEHPAASKRAVFVAVRGNPQPEVELQPVARAFGLSAAEAKVLLHLGQGAAPKRIASTLGVSPNTVRAHLRSLYLKMHVRGMNALMREYTRLTS